MANYTKTTWVNDTAPAINQTNLNNMEDGIYNAQADQMVLRGTAAARPATSTTTIGRTYTETDSPYKVWRDNGTGWDLATFAAAAEDTDTAFWNLTETLDDTTAYGLIWYGDKRTITLDPEAYALKLHYGQHITVQTDAACTNNVSHMQALYFDVSHYATASTVTIEQVGIDGTVANYGTIGVGAHCTAVDAYAYNAGTTAGSFRTVRAYLTNVGPGGGYTGVMATAAAGTFRITNEEQGQITEARVLSVEMNNVDVGSQVGTLAGLRFFFTNEGTVPSGRYIYADTPTDSGTVQNWAAIVLEDQAGIGTVTNHGFYFQAGGVGNDICWVDTNLYRAAADHLKSDDHIDGSADGVRTLTKAGAVGDGDFTTVGDGTVAIDSANGRFYFRHGGAWHYCTQDA